MTIHIWHLFLSKKELKSFINDFLFSVSSLRLKTGFRQVQNLHNKDLAKEEYHVSFKVTSCWNRKGLRLVTYFRITLPTGSAAQKSWRPKETFMSKSLNCAVFCKYPNPHKVGTLCTSKLNSCFESAWLHSWVDSKQGVLLYMSQTPKGLKWWLNS